MWPWKVFCIDNELAAEEHAAVIQEITAVREEVKELAKIVKQQSRYDVQEAIFAMDVTVRNQLRAIGTAIDKLNDNGAK